MKKYYGYSIESAEREREQRLKIIYLKKNHFTIKEIFFYFETRLNEPLKETYIRDCLNHFPEIEDVNKHYDKIVSKIISINEPLKKEVNKSFKNHNIVISYRNYLKNIQKINSDLISVFYLDSKTHIEHKALLIKQLSLNYSNGYILVNKYNERFFVSKKCVKLAKDY